MLSLEKCPLSGFGASTGETQMETRRSHLTPVGMAILRRHRVSVKKGGLGSLARCRWGGQMLQLYGRWHGASSHGYRERTAVRSRHPSGYAPERTDIGLLKRHLHPGLSAALRMAAETRDQAKWPIHLPTAKKMCTRVMECHSAQKEILAFATPQMNTRGGPETVGLCQPG